MHNLVWSQSPALRINEIVVEWCGYCVWCRSLVDVALAQSSLSCTSATTCAVPVLHCFAFRRKFRSQTSDNMDRWKAEQGRGREKRKIRREKSRRERVRRKKMQMREKVGKSRNTGVFPMIWGSGGSKSRLAKAAGAEPAGQMRDEKVHALVARSTYRSQNV